MFLIPLSIPFLNPKILGFLFFQAWGVQCEKFNFRKSQEINQINLAQYMKKRSSSGSRKFQAIFAWLNRYFTGYSRWVPQWTVLRPFCYCQNHAFGSPREPHQLPSWICIQLLLRETLFYFIFFCVPCCGENRSV